MQRMKTVGTVDVDEYNRCGSSIEEMLKGSKFTAAVTASRVKVGTGNMNLTNQLTCVLGSLPATNKPPLYQGVRKHDQNAKNNDT